MSTSIVSKKIDGLLVFGFGLAFALLLAFTYSLGIGFIFVAVAFAIIADLPHVLHTTLRLWSDTEDWIAHRASWWVSLLALSFAAICLYASGDLAWLVIVWVYWQPYHVFKQNFGIVKIYTGKARVPTFSGPLIYALFFGCLAPILYRVHETGLSFGDYLVFGKPLPFSGVDIPVPNIPMSVVWIAYAFAAVAIALAVYEWARLSKEQRRDTAFAVATVFAFVCTYNFAYLLFSDLYVLVLIATSMHALQYHLIIHAMQVRRASDDGRGTEGLAQSLLQYYADPSKIWIIVATLIAAALIVSSFEFVWGGILPLVLILHHFYLDGVIWKSGNQKPSAQRPL